MKGNFQRMKSQLFKRGLAWILVFGMMFNVFPMDAFGTLGVSNVFADEIATSSNASGILEDGELENDLLALSEQVDVRANGTIYSSTMYENQIVFTGVDQIRFVPGERVNLLDGVSASVPGYDYNITVRVVEIKDSNGVYYPNARTFRVPETENVTYSVKYMAYIKREELERLGNVVIATSSNATSFFRGTSAPVATSAGLPVGGLVQLMDIQIGAGQAKLTVDNLRTGSERSYSDLTVSALIKVDATVSDKDLPGAYMLLKVPTKHLDTTPLNARGEIAGLRINSSTLVNNSTITYSTQMINGEEYHVAKIMFSQLTRTTSGDLPYNIKFSNDRKTPIDYVLETEVEFFEGDGTRIGSSPKADFKILYDNQVITKYALSNKDEMFSNSNQILYGGPTVNNIIQAATAVNVPFRFNMQTKNPTSSYSLANFIYRQRLIEKIVLEEVLPTYTNHLTGDANFPAVFVEADNPGWTVSATDGEGRPTKVKKEVISVSDNNLTGGADAVLKNDVVLNLKFPGLDTNVKSVSGLRVSGDLTNVINAKLIPYGATAVEVDVINPEPTLHVSDDLSFNIEPNPPSGSGMITKTNLEANITIENGFMHSDAKGANFVVRFLNKTPNPTSALSLYDFGADPRTYYKEIEFRSNEGSVGADKIEEIWGVDENRNRITRLYSKTTGPALPAATGPTNNSALIQRVKIPLDQPVTDAVSAMVAGVESGLVLDTATTAVPRTYQGIEVVYGEPIPAYESVMFRMHLGFRDPYNVRLNNPDDLIENSAGFKAKYNENGVDRTIVGNITQNRTRLIALQEWIEFRKATATNPTGDKNEPVVYRINFFFTGMSNSRVFKNARIIELLPYGMEFVGFHNTQYNVTPQLIERITDYKGTGRTALVIGLGDVKVDGFPVDGINRKWMQVQVIGKIVPGMFPDASGVMPQNRNEVFLMADNLYPLSSALTIRNDGGTMNAAGERWGLVDDIYDVDNNPNTTKVLGASSKTKVNVGGQVVSMKQIRNLNGNWHPGSSNNMNASNGIVTRFDEEFEYSILTENMTTGAYNGYAVYDILPYVGDSAYTGTSNQRASQFRNRLQGPLVSSVPGDYIIEYSTNPNPNRDAMAAMTDANMGWTQAGGITNWESVTAIKITLAPGKVLKESSVVRFTARMKAPAWPGRTEAERLYLTRATNNFMVAYHYGTANAGFGASNSVFNILGRNIVVDKEWSGVNLNIPITVQLKQNGQNFSSDLYPNGRITLRPNTDPNQNYTSMFERIPVSDGNGNRYTYTLEEVGIGTGDLANYQAVVTGDDEHGFVVRNIEKKDLTIKKIWQDAGFTQLVRPQSIQIQLKRSIVGAASENVGSAITMSGATDTWEHTYTGLPVSDNAGNVYTYTVEELQNNALRNYGTPVIVDVSDTEITITNTLVLRDLPVKKVWRNDAGLGTRPNALTVKLFRGTTEIDSAVLSGSTDTWTHTFQNLLKYDMAGNEIAYTLTEEAVGLNNYLQTPATTEADGSMTLVNTFVPFAVRAVVNWVDDNNSLETRPASVHITLQRSIDGGATYEDVPGEVNREFNAANGYTHDYANVPKYSPNNVEYKYRIVQADNVNLMNYPNDTAHRVYTEDNSGNVKEFKFTNIFHTTAVQGRKVWEELGSAYTRPQNLNIQLFRNNDTASAYRTQTITNLDADPLSPGNRWLYAFANLPVYDQNGVAYTYSVAEEVVPDFYMAVVNGYEITNTYPRDTEIKVKKVWDHGDLAQRFHATSATFELLRDNTVFDRVTLDAANAATHHWEHTFFIGESNARGHSFTVREVDIPNYAAEYSNSGANETTVKNTYSPVPVEVRLTGQKNVTGKYIPEDELYKFVLEPVDGAIMPNNHAGAMEIERLKGAFDFGAISYRYPGEYKYRIWEINTGAEGFTYDPSVYDVKVTVDQSVQGLVADVQYQRNGVNVNLAEFNNTYIPPLGDLTFWNRVKGRNTVPQNDYYIRITFEGDEVFEYTGVQNGTFTDSKVFILKRNQKITIKDLPVGIKYKVEVLNAGIQYTEEYVGDGKIKKGANEVELVHFEVRFRYSGVVGGGASVFREGGPGTQLTPVAMDDYFEDETRVYENTDSVPTTVPETEEVIVELPKTAVNQIAKVAGRIVPRTSDQANFAAFIGIMFVSIAGFIFVAFKKKKEKEDATK